MGKTDLYKKNCDVKDHWEHYDCMRPKQSFDTLTVAVFAVNQLCDIILYEYLMMLHPNIQKVPF